MAECNYSTCRRPKEGLSNYCSYHRNKKAKYGHVDGRSIRKQEYLVERVRVERFIDSYGDKVRELQVALTEIETLLTYPQRISEDTLRKAMTSLKDNSVKPIDIIEEFLAVCMFSDSNHEELPSDERLTYMIGRAVLRLGNSSVGSVYDHEERKAKTIYRNYTGKICRVLGEFLRGRYSRLSAVTKVVIEQHEQQAKENKLLLKPFDINNIEEI